MGGGRGGGSEYLAAGGEAVDAIGSDDGDGRRGGGGGGRKQQTCCKRLNLWCGGGGMRVAVRVRFYMKKRYLRKDTIVIVVSVPRTDQSGALGIMSSHLFIYISVSVYSKV